MSQEEVAMLAEEGFASVREAEKFLSLCRSQVYEMVQKGELVSVKIGGARRIPWVALKQFARRQIEASVRRPEAVAV